MAREDLLETITVEIGDGLAKMRGNQEIAKRIIAICDRENASAIQKKDSRIAELELALKADATDLWGISNGIKKILESRSWILEGRGSYAWDDQRYKDETRMAFEDLLFGFSCKAYNPLKRWFSFKGVEKWSIGFLALSRFLSSRLLSYPAGRRFLRLSRPQTRKRDASSFPHSYQSPSSSLHYLSGFSPSTRRLSEAGG